MTLNAIDTQTVTSGALLDADQAAQYLGCTPRMVRELWQRRELPAVRIGRLIRYRRADLDAYVESRRVSAVRGPLAGLPR